MEGRTEWPMMTTKLIHKHLSLTKPLGVKMHFIIEAFNVNDTY
jgi:hypothetical protein